MIALQALTRLSTTVSIAALALGAAPAAAQDFDLGVIVVTPNRTPAEESTVGSSVEKIDREEMEKQSLPLVTDYLIQVPGVAITAPGGPGAESSLAIRGAPRRYVKTLYNGIDISDPTSTQVQTSYQYLLSPGIDSIEVLKGSQSTLYGSDAIAGVISLSTLGGIEPGISHIVAGEGGSYGTVRGLYGLRAANERAKLSLNVTGLTTDGFSAAAAGSERDGYENVTFDINGEYRFNEMFSVFASGLYIDAEAAFDDSFPSPSDNLTATNLSKQLAGRAGFNLDLLDGRFRNTVSVQAFDLERTIDGTFFDGTYEGRRYKADYQGAFDVNEWLTLQGGAEHEVQKASDPSGTKADFHVTGLWSEALIAPSENLTLTAGLRHDEHSAFGGHTTWRATGSYLFDGTGTRLHGSVGTGFRAPSLNELFGPFGANPDLKPETSIGFDIGVEQTLLDGALVADVTYFDLAIDDLIGFVCPDPAVDPFCLTGGYNQIPGTSRSRGVEASVAYAVNSQLSLGGSYTYTHSEDQTGARLPRIPRHTIGLSADYKPAEKWTVSANALAAIDTVDTDGLPLDDYLLLNAKLAYNPTEDTELYVRVENLLDQDYQTARGFNTPGLSVFAGFSAKFGP